MAKGIIKISGFLHKEPKENKDGSYALMFKVPYFNEEQLNEKVSFCVVHVDKQRYGRVKKNIGENTFCYVEGDFKVSKNQKNIPFLNIRCHSIKAANLLKKDFTCNCVNLTENFPWGTDELLDISKINIKEKLNIPTVAKKNAVDYIIRHGNFKKPILLKMESLNLIEGYGYYLAAKELGISKVPISYMQNYYKPGDEDYNNSLKAWYIDEEINYIDVKDIVLQEEVHLKVKHFAFYFNLDNYSKDFNYYPPVAVRPSGDGKYILVMGASRYFAAKIMDINKIPAVIKDMNHDEFMRFYKHEVMEIKKKEAEENSSKEKRTKSIRVEEIEMSLITVPETFANTIPKREKITDTIDYYKKHNKFDKPIVIKGSNYTITDGYKRYVAAKELKLTKILAKVMP